MQSTAKLRDLYSDYLIVNQSQCICTGLGSELGLSHDKFTRMLHKENLDSKWLWKNVKPLASRISSEQGVLILDDTIEEKYYSRVSDWNCYHWDHCKNRSVKGINQLSALYHSKSISIPVGFEVVTKPDTIIDKKTGKEKRVSKVSKQDLFRKLINQSVDNQLEIGHILADKWFSSKENRVTELAEV
jgi:DDE superfamily endonuclease